MNEIIKLINPDDFDALLMQINKDVSLAGIDSDNFKNIATAEVLVDRMRGFIDALITNYQESFNNFMYRVDIPEKDVAKLNHGKMDNLIDEITYHIIKREMQKVFFKKQFG
jgi:hypothetical protein